MKFKKVKCYRVDLLYPGNPAIDVNDGFIPISCLHYLINDEVDSCDIVIKDQTIILLPDDTQ